MDSLHVIFNFYAFLSFLVIFCKLSSATDTITQTKSIIDGETLVSSGQTFELGFFSPVNSKNRYIGIWYRRTPDVVVWVANRNNPLHDSLGELIINNKTDQVVLLNQSKSIVWSTNSSKSVAKNPVAQLLDSGNLVLREDESMISELYLWESFDYPSDTLLAGMKLGWDLNIGFERYLTSWKSIDDPSNGDFVCRMEMKGLPGMELIVAKGSTKIYRSGPWNGVRFSGAVPLGNLIVEKHAVVNENEAYYILGTTENSVFSRITINHSGLVQQLILENKSTVWDIMYERPNEPCESYGYCGANSICRLNLNPMCECLEWFVPTSQEQWDVLNWSNGCRRKTALNCQKGEGFAKIKRVKLPDLLDFWLKKNIGLEECKEMCLNNCSCTAYANSDIRRGGSGCLMWFGDLIDVRDFHVDGSDQDMYIRMSASEMKLIHDATKKKRLKIILVTSTLLGICISGLVLWCIIWKSRKVLRGKSKDEDIELPLFDLAMITTATNNFSPENEIGAGGFGSVYKGKLSTGQDIAVKRLSKDSRQGVKEFKNEVELIAKLQHRNLVALLGCCIEGEERMLIYEYMPNKSLNHFIFDRIRSSTMLPWKKHFDIVMGIARGLLYLHRDSKLHIIHRDLKASNILLDSNLNPKISDFGLARILQDDEKEAKTRRVVGTYGYMSPEYAIDGKFSVKSDVFSFGVLLLEMVSGKRNRGFRHPDHNHTLLGHAWLLWEEEEPLDLMDERFKDSCVETQVQRCIQVGLLCVQKFPNDRPTMSSVVVMLENDGITLPQPKEPGFFTERSSTDEGLTPRSKECHSVNGLTVTTPNGR
ncbi:hypothetical protein UlMin_003363 [Ulmus minor]